MLIGDRDIPDVGEDRDAFGDSPEGVAGRSAGRRMGAALLGVRRGAEATKLRVAAVACRWAVAVLGTIALVSKHPSAAVTASFAACSVLLVALEGGTFAAWRRRRRSPTT
jgi:hypothetical protein